MSKSIFEEIAVTGEELLKKVREIIKKGNVRRMIIRNKKGEKILETPLSVGATSIGGMIWLMPFLSAVTFVALMVSEATIVVEREPGYDEKEVEAEEIEVVACLRHLR